MSSINSELMKKILSRTEKYKGLSKEDRITLYYELEDANKFKLKEQWKEQHKDRIRAEIYINNPSLSNEERLILYESTIEEEWLTSYILTEIKETCDQLEQEKKKINDERIKYNEFLEEEKKKINDERLKLEEEKKKLNNDRVKLEDDIKNEKKKLNEEQIKLEQKQKIFNDDIDRVNRSKLLDEDIKQFWSKMETLFKKVTRSAATYAWHSRESEMGHKDLSIINNNNNYYIEYVINKQNCYSQMFDEKIIAHELPQLYK
jgi:hypothetical protein